MNALKIEWLLGSGDDNRRTDNNKGNITALLFQYSLSQNFRESIRVQVLVFHQPIYKHSEIKFLKMIVYAFTKYNGIY